MTIVFSKDFCSATILYNATMLDQELLTKGGLTDGQQQPPPPHLTNPYSQFQQYQQSMAGYNNVGYGFPMYTQNGYGYPLSGYPHAPSPPSDGKSTPPKDAPSPPLITNKRRKRLE